MRRIVFVLSVLAFSAVLTGCMRDMQDNSRYKPLEKSSFFEDGSSSRPFVEGTVARGSLKTDPYLYTSTVDGQLVDQLPVALTMELMERGQERYDIFCAACHGKYGDGDGMVVRRGFPEPKTFHSDRLRNAPEGYYFEVITNGMGKMAAFSDQLKAKDRWAVVAYIRALQRSRNSQMSDVPRKEKQKLMDAF